MAEERFTGVVQWFNNSKGFGFIKPDDGGEDLFIHHSSIRSDGFRTLLEGDRVEFSIAIGDNHKTKAVDVTAPNGAPLRSNQDSHGGARGGNSGGCYQCGDFGHLARDCNRSSNAGGNACFNCGGFGHMARDCSRGSNRGGGGVGVGVGVGVGGDGSCYRCGELGHMARDCDKGNSDGAGGNGGGCFRCGEIGHMARDCSKEGERSYGGKTSACFNCGKPGHFARECVEASG